MFDAVWTRVVAGSYVSVPARVRGFSRFAVVGESYPAVVHSAFGEVIGRAYLDVAPDDLARLDAFEGADYLRTSTLIEMLDPEFDPVSAQSPPPGRGAAPADLYVFRAAARVAPHPWDATRFGREQIEQFLDTYASASRPRR